MKEVDIASASPRRFDPLLGPRRADEFGGVLAEAAEMFRGRTVWHVNSTERGGGVAEMLQSVLRYLVGGGLRTRWMVIEGDDDFFAVTKRLHYLLHGAAADDGSLGPGERLVYERALEAEAMRMAELVRPGDPVVLHDPQTVGLAPVLARAGAHIVWICHVGADAPNDVARRAWAFLMPYLAHTGAQVFSRKEYVFEGLDPARVLVAPPCIDVFSPKNQDLDDATVSAILGSSGIVPAHGGGRPAFTTESGATRVLSATATMVEAVPVPSSAPLVSQVSRWDPLKDHAGVMDGFVRHVPAGTGAHLVLAGPSPDSVADDPSGAVVFDALRRSWASLDAADQQRVHLACIPMRDVDENAAIVNALQRRSDVIVQKSIAEGFGLTVTEAMWKSRPVVATRVGGIQDQITDGRSGLLVDDPTDVAAVGRAVRGVLADRDTAAALGRGAHARVLEEYLAPCWYTRLVRAMTTLASAAPRGKGLPVGPRR